MNQNFPTRCRRYSAIARPHPRRFLPPDLAPLIHRRPDRHPVLQKAAPSVDPGIPVRQWVRNFSADTGIVVILLADSIHNYYIQGGASGRMGWVDCYFGCSTESVR